MHYWFFPGFDRKSGYIVAADKICEVVLDYFGFTREQVFRKDRRRNLVVCRQFMILFMKERTRMRLKEIASYGWTEKDGIDHTTAIYSIKTIKNLMDVDSLILQHYREISEMIDRS